MSEKIGKGEWGKNPGERLNMELVKGPTERLNLEWVKEPRERLKAYVKRWALSLSGKLDHAKENETADSITDSEEATMRLADFIDRDDIPDDLVETNTIILDIMAGMSGPEGHGPTKNYNIGTIFLLPVPVIAEDVKVLGNDGRLMDCIAVLRLVSAPPEGFPENVYYEMVNESVRRSMELIIENLAEKKRASGSDFDTRLAMWACAMPRFVSEKLITVLKRRDRFKQTNTGVDMYG